MIRLRSQWSTSLGPETGQFVAAAPLVSARDGDGIVETTLDAVLTADAATVEIVLAVRHPVATKLMTSVTGLGTMAAAVVFLGLCYLAGWRREVAVGAVALSVTGAVVFPLMALVQRPFPPQPVCVTRGPGLPAHSFPSGHAAAAAVYTFLARDSERLPYGVVTALAGLIAVSRIYLGTHYLSDTVVGVLIGAGAVLLGRRLVAGNDRLLAAVDSLGRG
jgi:undecaprenyl-diphosphatase